MGSKRRTGPDSGGNVRKKTKGADTVESGARRTPRPQELTDDRENEDAPRDVDETADESEPARNLAKHDIAEQNNHSSTHEGSGEHEKVVDEATNVDQRALNGLDLTSSAHKPPQSPAPDQWRLDEWKGIWHYCKLVTTTEKDAWVVHPRSRIYVRIVVPTESLRDPYPLLKSRPTGVQSKSLRTVSGTSKPAINERGMVFAQAPNHDVMLPAVVIKKNTTHFTVKFKHNGSQAKLTRTKLLPKYLGDPGVLSAKNREDIWPGVADDKAVQGSEGVAYRKQHVEGYRLKIPDLPPPTATRGWSPDTAILDQEDLDWRDILDMPPSTSALDPAVLNCRLCSASSPKWQCGLLIVDSPSPF